MNKQNFQIIKRPPRIFQDDKGNYIKLNGKKMYIKQKQKMTNKQLVNVVVKNIIHEQKRKIKRRKKPYKKIEAKVEAIKPSLSIPRPVYFPTPSQPYQPQRPAPQPVAPQPVAPQPVAPQPIIAQPLPLPAKQATAPVKQVLIPQYAVPIPTPSNVKYLQPEQSTIESLRPAMPSIEEKPMITTKPIKQTVEPIKQTVKAIKGPDPEIVSFINWIGKSKRDKDKFNKLFKELYIKQNPNDEYGYGMNIYEALFNMKKEDPEFYYTLINNPIKGMEYDKFNALWNDRYDRKFSEGFKQDFIKYYEKKLGTKADPEDMTIIIEEIARNSNTKKDWEKYKDFKDIEKKFYNIVMKNPNIEGPNIEGPEGKEEEEKIEGEGIGNDSGLYNYEIIEYMKPYKKEGFLGVIASNQISSLVPFVQPNKPFSFIMNLDASNKKGSHWVAINVTNDSLEYYDSLGNPPSDIFNRDIKLLIDKFEPDVYLKYKVNKIIRQGNSSLCGYHAMNFLIDRYNRKEFKDSTGYSDIREGEGKALELKNKLEKQEGFGYI